MPQKFHITATTVSGYFKHRCDRLFRWKAVPNAAKERPGIGWNVPKNLRKHSRPGIALLMEAGDTFEKEQVQQIIDEAGEDRVAFAGFGTERGREKVLSLPLSDFLTALNQDTPPQYIAQLDIDLDQLAGAEAAFLRRFDLDPDAITVGTARPDLLEIIESAADGAPHRLRIWDFKASQAARHEHFIQVAYYSYLLEVVLAAVGLDTDFRVDTDFAVIRSFDGDETFELAPYRLAVADFLQNLAPALLDTPAADAHYLVHEKCALCEYMDTCQAEADAGFDLSRVAYISSESKRQLNAQGIRNHRELAQLTPAHGQADLIENLRTANHDLTVNLDRYVAVAQTLEDGQERPLETSTLLMPQWDNIRVVLSAEQDPVTNTCFALGIKAFEWDRANNRPGGIEDVYLSEGPDAEGEMLLAFLRTLNGLLLRVDRENRAIADQPLTSVSAYAAAQQGLTAAEADLAAFKQEHPLLHRHLPNVDQLKKQREALKKRVKDAKSALKDAQRAEEWERIKEQTTLHFYVYDGIDLLILKSVLERHLFDPEPELLAEMRVLVRLFPPESLLPDADTFRTIPGTIVTQVLRKLVALPVPYIYDLRSVSEIFRPTNSKGEESGYVFKPRYGFGWQHSNQVAFERIHDYWNREDYVPDSRNPARTMSPEDIRHQIVRTVESKLRATDGVVWALKQKYGDSLILQKEPFRLHADFDPLDFHMLEALRVFTTLESALSELGVKHLHTQPIADRVTKFECIRGLRYLPAADPGDGTLWFTFDPGSVDAKFDEGDFNLVLTPEDDPEVLLGQVDYKLFQSSWRSSYYKVTLVEYDLQADPPRVRLQPNNPYGLQQKVDLSRPLVLDRLYIDYNTHRVINVLRQLQSNDAAAAHIQELIATGARADWRPPLEDFEQAEADLTALVAQSGGDPNTFLNPSQRRAFRGVAETPLSLIWGPPGTGKTYTLGHILLGYALAAQRAQRPLRLLVTAFTHHAIGNVLIKVSELATNYGLNRDQLRILKTRGSFDHPANDLLPDDVEHVRENGLSAALRDPAPVMIVGSTVWGIYKAMDKATEDGVVQPWFDVILIDEASQLKLPEALIALSAGRPEGNIILAGDDRQLPPIIHGTYPEEQEYMLTSVFAFMRDRMETLAETDPQAANEMLFQLEENFRMNEPLTAYPRETLYNGRFFSQQPRTRIMTQPPLSAATDDPLAFMLHPERPVVLCWYEPPASFTARNDIEADLVARLTDRLSRILINPDTGNPYDADAFAGQGLAILSPHRAQNSTIRQTLDALGFDDQTRPRPLVDTVDKLQGQERDVVFVSYGVADGEYAEAEAEFLLSSNRFNVATTRPKQKLVLFCSSTVLDMVPDDRQILLDAMMLKEFRRYCNSGRRQFTWPTDDYGDVTLNVQWRGF